MKVERILAPELPPSKLRAVRNLTPHAHAKVMKMGPGRTYFDVLVVKATYALAEGRLAPAGTPRPIAYADRWHDPSRAARSSLRVAGDVVLTKPYADVMVVGTAHAPGGMAAWWDCGVVVTSASWELRHGARVTGPRRFTRGAVRGWTLSDPEPVPSVPIRYERAFGGVALTDRGERVHEPNPSGVGFVDPRFLRAEQVVEAPQWVPPEHAEPALGEVVPLAGFGPVARPWTARLQHAGTYDEAWIERARAEAREGLPPDYAADFDPRFFQCAHPSLVAPGALGGDERVGLMGLVAGKPRFTFELPGERLTVHFKPYVGPWYELPMVMDTILVDLDEAVVELVWRATFPLEMDIGAAVVARADAGRAGGG